MMRGRYIKPGIVSNEELCALGPYAYILFTGLWMLADREGRLEDRPKRIKALIMPLWDEAPWPVVDDLLKKLSESGFIHRYEVDGNCYIQITNWRRHQQPHQREAASVVPPDPGLVAEVSTGCDDAQPRRCPGTAKAMPSPPLTRTITTTTSGGGSPPSGVEGASDENSSPPPSKPRQKRKPPGSERRAQAEAPPKPRAPPEEVNQLRDSLHNLAREIRMPPPDDQMVLRILDAGHGATAMEIHETLVLLWRRSKFRDMRSWGLLPVLLADRFGRRLTVAASA